MSEFAALVESNRRLTETVEGKAGEIDQRVEQFEQESQAAIDRLNQGNLESLILVKNQNAIDLGLPTKPYQRFVAYWTGQGDGGATAWVDLTKLQTNYQGHYIKVNMSTYQRGTQNGISGTVNIRCATSNFVNPKVDNFIISNESSADVSSYFRLVNMDGTIISPDESGVYSVPEGTKVKVQVKVTVYWQLSAVVDVQTL
ncbi:hypothetical protein ACSTID_14690 [Vibrio parahaemolyticus]|uniref:hypothetical protein n=1 Tax=Vibrio parahaemolyticus TaxID=670 RepID=UPI0024AF6894|nr:hypothetical protein [Vibrio parahaemolyticus]MDI7855084.1 hypothetical protein [Vibrio parahaemolyticus]